ncbi:hypothetical protein I7I50_07660 [Histoplasma capsulatum G186AR]|uniref:Uncharacterized protein n=1 Tax=Ajellomyces capsulatus TaxID=5037 RepID=A0A8H7YV25_AJECA|nr:hypothetical protein I7I52_09268 [Histoplasma capsulatum]QSS68300.1 hypothetical protein I7I50_07660 [Histoplasma capsulatum G186AR]
MGIQSIFSSQQKLSSRGCTRAKARSYESRVCCVLKAVEAGYRGGISGEERAENSGGWEFICFERGITRQDLYVLY